MPYIVDLAKVMRDAYSNVHNRRRPEGDEKWFFPAKHSLRMCRIQVRLFVVPREPQYRRNEFKRKSSFRATSSAWPKRTGTSLPISVYKRYEGWHFLFSVRLLPPYCFGFLWHGAVIPLCRGHGGVHALDPVSLLTSVKEFTPFKMSAEIVVVLP